MAGKRLLLVTVVVVLASMGLLAAALAEEEDLVDPAPSDELIIVDVHEDYDFERPGRDAPVHEEFVPVEGGMVHRFEFVMPDNVHDDNITFVVPGSGGGGAVGIGCSGSGEEIVYESILTDCIDMQ